ncbi:MAG TPA: hypothetical protein VGJ16_07165 [Pirellulales bacterium]|jgi:hypothetical protein
MNAKPPKIASLLVFVVVAALISQAGSAEEGTRETGRKPYVSFSGAHSKIERQSYELITSADDWAKLWHRHLGKELKGNYDYFYNPEGIPAVDFDSCMVIAIMRGKQINVAGIEVVMMGKIAGLMTVRFRDKTFQTFGTAKDNGGARATTPYGFFVVPNSPNAIVLEQHDAQYKNDPPKWRKVFRFR